MNPSQQECWINEVLGEVMAALMHDAELRKALIFKGARVLNLHLGQSRHSMDIDAIMEPACVQQIGDLEAQENFLKEHLPRAVRRHFESQDPVRFTLADAKFERNPATGHPRGWDMLVVKLVIHDHQMNHVRSLPPAELEVAAAESYSSDAVEWLDFQGVQACVYTLHRIAGEKLRAYLTSLPAYRLKMGGGTREFRVKDLHDLARIVHHRPLTDTLFWQRAAKEFKLACESRRVDCDGPATFKQEWDQARIRYEQDQHLSTVPFCEAEAALDEVLAALSQMSIFPMHYPL